MLVVVGESLFCGVVLSVVSCFAIFWLRKDDLVSLLHSCSCWCDFQCSLSLPRGANGFFLYFFLYLLHSVTSDHYCRCACKLRVGLWCVKVAFAGHIHLFVLALTYHEVACLVLKKEINLHIYLRS